ncbi:HAD family hydrolase [Haloarchaeobius sp. DFWS5]|uniref:HAD family hydrolase n=1 Tax=Haloarchaeobius sp. DFWS5 TaxID=3446114 RepID=UPI003EBB1DDC
MQSQPVDTVLFDLDDTLCTYRRDQSELLSVSFDSVGVDPFFDATDYVDRYETFVDDSDDMLDLRRRCFADLAESSGYDPTVGHDVAAAYAEQRDHANVDPIPGANEAVEALAAEYRLAVVTNGDPEMQAEKLSALPFGDAFEYVVCAGYDAPSKPHPGAFHRVLDLLDAEPERTVHIGNSLRSDVAGAQAADIRAAWLSDGSTPDPVPTYEIDSMTALLTPPWKTTEVGR